MLNIDLETRSDTDLTFHGLRRYAEDPSTEVICMAYAFDDEDIQFWWGRRWEMRDGVVFTGLEPFPQEVIDHFTGGLNTAHNASFEKHIFDHVLTRTHKVEAPRNEQWRCSMAQGLTNGFAGGLDALAVGLGLPYRKHSQGTRLIREYCASGHKDIFAPENAKDREFMKEYCISDVEIMRAAVKCLRPLTDDEWEEYHLNCRINERGLPIDVDFCKAALGYTHEIAADANAQISKLTGGKMVKATQRKSRDEWLFPKLTEYQMKLLEVYKKGEKKISLDQDHRRYLLECEDLDHEARSLLEYIDNAGSSALKKFAVAAHQHVKGRVHNTFLWNGAQPGRFSGKNMQPHNIRRDVFKQKEAERLIKEILDGYELDTPATTMARLGRSMIYHPAGLYWVDWSAIQGRIAPWLSISEAGERKLDLYRENRDVYVVTAADMFALNEGDMLHALADDQEAHPYRAEATTYRQSGKVCELSLQFGGGFGALISMAKNYGITFEEAVAKDYVGKWRTTNPWAEAIWADYDRAISGAVRNPGVPYEVGRVTYQSDGENYLWCRLPSERLLSYPKPRFEVYTTPWGEERIGPTFQSRFKPAAGDPPIRRHARGALLFQNNVQAVEACILRETLLLADDVGLAIIGSVHDEVIGQGPSEDGEILNNIMLERPWWSDGLPLATGGVQIGKRWGK